jgi:polysaccharide deacetylase 2 family uncharacterized protein YibQ
VATDDLSAPLGQSASNAKRRHIVLPFTFSHALIGALTLALLTFAGWALVVDDPLGGEPIAVIATGVPPKPETTIPPIASGPTAGPRIYDGPAPADTPQPSQTIPAVPAAPPAGTQTVTIIDGSTGKRQDVAIPKPQDARARTDQRFTEITRHGAIPKLGPDGSRPAEAYARAVKMPPGKADAPRIAIIVTGLGVSAAATQEALTKLPGPVTFAFMPYGPEVEGAATRARAQGHEILLQVPMEPFDYPDNDPGPQTLLHSLNAEQNLDRLHWLLSRLQGYVGIANFMGARFTSFEPAFSPVLRDVGKRGLIYVDDGSSPRSLAGQIAGANNLPFARADVTIDSVASPGHIDKALARLEAMARERGAAVGIASALPATIQRIAQWSRAVENRGIVLVPITAIAVKPKSS